MVQSVENCDGELSLSTESESQPGQDVYSKAIRSIRINKIKKFLESVKDDFGLLDNPKDGKLKTAHHNSKYHDFLDNIAQSQQEITVVTRNFNRLLVKYFPLQDRIDQLEKRTKGYINYLNNVVDIDDDNPQLLMHP